MIDMTKKIERALVSVSDKTGIVGFAKTLTKLGIEIISTGGTSKLLKENNVAVTEISEYTGVPEILGGRVRLYIQKSMQGSFTDASIQRMRRRIGILESNPSIW